MTRNWNSLTIHCFVLCSFKVSVITHTNNLFQGPRVQLLKSTGRMYAAEMSEYSGPPSGTPPSNRHVVRNHPPTWNHQGPVVTTIAGMSNNLGVSYGAKRTGNRDIDPNKSVRYFVVPYCFTGVCFILFYYMLICVCLYVSVLFCIGFFVCVYVCVCVFMYLCVYLCTCPCVCGCACVFVYVEVSCIQGIPSTMFLDEISCILSKPLFSLRKCLYS